MTNNYLDHVVAVWLGVILCFSNAAYSLPYGSPDSRSAAMGKTGVAMPGSTNAAYFNPALLAVYPVRKHLGNNQRIAIPTVVGYISDNTLELGKIEDADYDQQLSSGITEFNTSGDPDNLIDSLESLSDDLRDTSSEPLYADGFANLVVSIPDRHEGGAFYFSSRGVVDGRLDYTSSDQSLITAYLEELNFISSGGTPATLHPELYSGGQLIDSVESLTSSVDAVALVIDELGTSMGWLVSWWDTEMMVGVTPKVIHITSYEFTADATGTHLTQSRKYDNDTKLNVDLGWAKQLNERLLLGLGIRNLLPQEYRTRSGRTIKLRPQMRAGASYQSEWGYYTVDLDLLNNDPISNGDSTQELGVGGEWSVGHHAIRAGIVKNFKGSGANASPLFTLGVCFNLGRFYTDLSYGDGSNQRSAAFQLGLQF
jgi:hypothetical protein